MRQMQDLRLRALVLGVGNLLWADEGFGVRAVERFFEIYEPCEAVEVVDGGTRGMSLLPQVQDCDLLIMLDAVDFDLAPGTLHALSGEQVPAFLGAKKMSLHQTGFQEVLALAELTGTLPYHLMLIGVQPEMLEDYGGSLTPKVAARIDEAVGLVADCLTRHGFVLQRRSGAPAAGDLGPAALSRRIYEDERPSEVEACRIGDDRFLAMRTR